MGPLLYILIAIAAAGAVILIVLRRRLFPGGKSRRALIGEATRRLAQDPRDAEALQVLADAAFEEGDFQKAYNYYQSLLPLCPGHPDVDEFTVTLRLAQSAYNAKKLDEAYKAFQLARTLNGEDFEANYNLGVLEYGRKNFPRAATCLRRAAAAQPDHGPTQKYLGHSLFQMKLYPEALAALRRSLDQEPEDKASRFALARCYSALNQNEPALTIFSHLLTDPEFGPQAALYAGAIHSNTRQYKAAAEDFQIGLRHESLTPSVALELKYRLASTLAKDGEVSAALKLWKEIEAAQPRYRDVQELLAQYQEISSNRHLQSFLLASSADFVTLCRKISAKYFAGATAKLLSISLRRAEYADVLAQVHTPQWEELVLFRFIRSAGSVGELMVRDFNGRLKEVRAGRGVCLAAGSFSEQARGYVEARKIDLVEREDLIRLFKRI